MRKKCIFTAIFEFNCYQMLKNRLSFLLLFSFHVLAAQYVPSPAPAQSEAILITGATAHLGNGEVLEDAVIAFENGKITAVGLASEKRLFPNHKVIEAKGKHIYPGLIAPNATLGLNEIGLVRATRDAREVGSFNPNVRSIIAYNTDSEVTPTVRANGVLLAQITPEGSGVIGTSSVVQLDAWNYEDAVVNLDDGIHMNWPSHFSWRGWWAEPGGIQKNEKYAEHVREIERNFQAAYAYTQKTNIAEKNLKFEAMRGLFDQSQQLFVHTNSAKAMQAAVLFAEKMNIKIVIIGGRESWLIADFLRDHQVPVILRPTQSLPRYQDADIDQPFKTAAQLQAAGVLWCFSGEGYWQQRNLPFQAGQAVGFGLEYEAAIAGLTGNTAKILGIEKEFGTLEVGKSATLILTSGDVLDMRTSLVEQAFIQGRALNLRHKQKELAEKFRAKY